MNVSGQEAAQYRRLMTSLRTGVDYLSNGRGRARSYKTQLLNTSIEVRMVLERAMPNIPLEKASGAAVS